MKVSLHHFGDLCYPYIIINHILNIRKKTLFQLGRYPFNSNLEILKEGIFEDMIEPRYLKDIAGTADIHQRYGHGVNVVNTRYDTVMNHDFIVENGIITNYGFVQRNLREKIANFFEDIKDWVIFINFSDEIENHKYQELVDVLTNQYGATKFQILVFTLSQKEIDVPEKVTIIRLENNYLGEWEKTFKQRMVIFREIHEKFRSLGLPDYPEFDQAFTGFK